MGSTSALHQYGFAAEVPPGLKLNQGSLLHGGLKACSALLSNRLGPSAIKTLKVKSRGRGRPPHTGLVNCVEAGDLSGEQRVLGELIAQRG